MDIFARLNSDSTYDICHVEDGEPVTRIPDSRVYPIDSSLSCAYEHPGGITLDARGCFDADVLCECGQPFELLECESCGASAVVCNCGCHRQPQPIAADAHGHAICCACSDAQPHG